MLQCCRCCAHLAVAAGPRAKAQRHKGQGQGWAHRPGQVPTTQRQPHVGPHMGGSRARPKQRCWMRASVAATQLHWLTKVGRGPSLPQASGSPSGGPRTPGVLYQTHSLPRMKMRSFWGLRNATWWLQELRGMGLGLGCSMGCARREQGATAHQEGTQPCTGQGRLCMTAGTATTRLQRGWGTRLQLLTRGLAATCLLHTRRRCSTTTLRLHTSTLQALQRTAATHLPLAKACHQLLWKQAEGRRCPSRGQAEQDNLQEMGILLLSSRQGPATSWSCTSRKLVAPRKSRSSGSQGRPGSMALAAVPKLQSRAPHRTLGIRSRSSNQVRTKTLQPDTHLGRWRGSPFPKILVARNPQVRKR